jgi:hypothetical protein
MEQTLLPHYVWAFLGLCNVVLAFWFVVYVMSFVDDSAEAVKSPAPPRRAAKIDRNAVPV